MAAILAPPQRKKWFVHSLWTLLMLKKEYAGYTVPTPGGRLNKKDGLTRYGDSHVKDKTS